ncbi:glycosyltransferase-like protein [Chlorella sorokiniana]|uniref:Glycosyltransferase-like protein n=1 Tax=Chlorella sorokiniana TaxID=3076 RepID=A0A2P6TQN1_CHLSO|nr:glycosyltransferase-like protein [Chlorella sorokiniana]|eukprot:PRW56345.1 glycosyltransferase-like protein [Chlorella sorokiniana]
MADEVAATLAALPHPAAAASVPDAAAAEAMGDVVAPGQAVSVPGVQPVRVVDQAFGPQSSENIPGVEDLHAELRAYNDALLAGMTLDESEAAARQHRATAAELGMLPLDGLNETASLPHRIAFLNDLYEEVQAGVPLRACLAATTSADVWGVRRELLPWLQYHTELGAARFYLLYDGQDVEAVRLLALVRHVTLIHIHPPFASAAQQAKFEAYARSAGDVATQQWGGQPGNFELMVKQGYGEHEALRLAKADGMHWLLHLDPDELLHPGGPAFSLPAVLARQPPHVPALRFMNYEGQPEAGDLTNRIEQVTLFRVHKHFITPEAHYWRQKYKLGDSAAFLTLYANGKSAVRVDAPGVRHLGPHFFLGDSSPRWATPANPTGAWREAVGDDSVVLHYAYSYERDVAAKAHRSCPDSYLEAARRGDRAKVKECFVIDFDADAYMAAAAGPAAARDFFLSRMVLSEGARVRCSKPGMQFGQQGWCTLSNIDRFKFLMEKVGLYHRVHGPQALLRQHERRIQERMRNEREQRWLVTNDKTASRDGSSSGTV